MPREWRRHDATETEFGVTALPKWRPGDAKGGNLAMQLWRLLDAIGTAIDIHFFLAGNRLYYCLPNFHKYQTLKYIKRSLYPPCPTCGGQRGDATTEGQSIREARSSREVQRSPRAEAAAQTAPAAARLQKEGETHREEALPNGAGRCSEVTKADSDSKSTHPTGEDVRSCVIAFKAFAQETGLHLENGVVCIAHPERLSPRLRAELRSVEESLPATLRGLGHMFAKPGEAVSHPLTVVLNAASRSSSSVSEEH